MKLFLSGLPRFNEKSLGDLKLFVKKNKIQKIYAAFWIFDLDSQKKVEKFRNIFKNADVFEVPENLFKSRDTFYWIELKDKRIEKQYFLLNFLLNKIPDQYGEFVRYRSDIVWEIIPQIKDKLKKNIFLTTPFEGHEYVPFEPNILNDQFYIAEISLIRSVFRIIFETNPKELRALHLKQKTKLCVTQPPWSLQGIEGLLFEILSELRADVNYCFGYYSIFYKPEQTLLKKLCLFEINHPSIFFFKNSPSRINLAFLINFFIWLPGRLSLKLNKVMKRIKFHLFS